MLRRDTSESSILRFNPPTYAFALIVGDETYGLIGKVEKLFYIGAGLTIKKVITVVAHNATNNDTLMESLEERCKSRGTTFSAIEARMQCMPHTVHLAALKILEAIGAVPKNQNSAAQSQNYQEIVTAPVGKDADHNDLVNQADEPEPVDPASVLNTEQDWENSWNVLSAVEKALERW
ncbi:hypothetical protein BD410DRAFT_840861 [Rickenella mellea]|uniref:Uncharacterized protein n=1 Tax=Rickenella mellea TaxID=50990 RepID=A0A4Y7Q0M3_9AGAM|nr:hypothetical protein BD410DRAFT_840861 [Rickenella mellea]